MWNLYALSKTNFFRSLCVKLRQDESWAFASGIAGIADGFFRNPASAGWAVNIQPIYGSLVGGWTNPTHLKKICASQISIISPKDRGENKKIFKTTI